MASKRTHLFVRQIMEDAVEELGFQLRDANGNDLDVTFDLFAQVLSIHAEAEPDFFRPAKKDEMFKRFFDGVISHSEQHLVFACVNGMEVGYIQYFMGTRPQDLYRPERRVACINQLVVAAEHRLSGCATALIDSVKQKARHEDIALLGIDFWSFNNAAQACFEKAGFKVNHEFMWIRL